MNYDEVYQEAEDHYISGDYQIELGLFERVLTMNNSGDCLNYIGCCYLKLGEFNSARETFKKLIEKSPDFEKTCNEHGESAFRVRKQQRSIRMF